MGNSTTPPNLRWSCPASHWRTGSGCSQLSARPDLTDAGKRTPFLSGLVIGPGAHMRIELDKDGWPGFALGKDDEFGIWTVDGVLGQEVDWTDG